MNRENVLYMKQIMEQAEALDMSSFQASNGDMLFGPLPLATTIEELHSCGNTACFAGYMALSEKFQNDGGEVTESGLPHFKGKNDAAAVAEWLGISFNLACSIVHGISSPGPFYANFFGIRFEDVQPRHLVKAMDMILDGELK